MYLQKADAIYMYLIQNTEYSKIIVPESYTSFGTLINGSSVCQGYSAAFNLIAKQAGISSLAVANKNHMWNVVLYNGTLYHYDTTFDDSGNTASELYKQIPEKDFIPDDDHKGYVIPQIFHF